MDRSQGREERCAFVTGTSFAQGKGRVETHTRCLVTRVIQKISSEDSRVLPVY